MSILFESLPSDFESHYALSYGYHTMNSGHLSEEYHDRSRPSISPISTKNEFAPESYSMDYNLSEGSFSDTEIFGWNPPLELGGGGDSISPMSANTFEQDHYPLWSTTSLSQAVQAMNTTATQRLSNTSNFGFNVPQQSHFSMRHFHDTLRPTQPVTGSTIPNNEDWSYQETGDHPDIKFDSGSDHEPFSASSYSTQASSQAPWSAVQQSQYQGSMVNQHLDYGLSNAGHLQNDPYLMSYAGSVMSIESSPLVQGVRTPSSTRSPQFAQAQLAGSAGSSTQPHTHDHQQETPRPLQIPFPPPRGANLNLDLYGVGQHRHESKHRRRRSQRDSTSSPVSDSYVMVPRMSAPSIDTSTLSSAQSGSTIKASQSPTVFVPEPWPASSEIAKQPSSSLVMRRPKDGKRAGGRTVGMHLQPDKAARAKLLREEGSCWICCLQRDSCTPGHVCDRCIKRNQRATMENGLGCDRTKLTDLKSYFLPDFLVRMGDKKVLSGFVEQHIGRWVSGAKKFRLNMIWGIPAMEFELYEFEPKTDELLRQMQYRLDESTGTRGWKEKRSPPLAMVHIENEDRNRYEEYLNNVVDKHLDKFVDRCYRYEKEDFQGRLFKLMAQLKPETREQTLLIRDIFRLQVVTYIYGRAATIVPRQIIQLYTLHYSTQNPHVRYEKATSPRMANRQLKVLYCSLFSQIMDSILRRLQQVLRSSRGGAKWTSAFIALLGLAMCFEEVQRNAHANQDADALMGQMSVLEATQSAEAACRCIDEKFQFMANLFRWKYHRGFNPLKDLDNPKVRADLSPSSLEFVKGVAALVQERHDFLLSQQHVPILKANQDKYTSRLVARFLLAFWGPTPT